MNSAFYKTEMTQLQQLGHHLRRRWIMFRRRYIPYLVWWNDELDINILFAEDRLRAQTLKEAHQDLFRGTFDIARKHLNEVGITFDHGLGLDGREWEWDWSLQGPVRVRFRGRAKYPDLRK